MKLSYHTLTYKNYPLEEALKRISKIGYEGVEFISLRPHAFPTDLDKKDRQAIVRLMKSLDLELAAFANYSMTIGLNMASGNEKIRASAIQYLKDCINLAYDLGSKITMLIPGTVMQGTPYKQAWSWTVEGLMECMSLAEDKDMIIALEPAFSLLNSTERTMEMIKEIGSKKGMVCLDTLLAYSLGESPTECVRKLGKAITHIHVWDGSLGAPVPPGKGHLNFELFIKALKEIGYDGYLSVELPPVIDPDALAFESKKYLDGLLKSM